MKSRFLLQEADRFIAFTDAGEKSCEWYFDEVKWMCICFRCDDVH
jgi:hypothetical protein